MKDIYMVTMEYAGIAEAGGVKLVSRSLCEEFAKEGCSVTVVMPSFGCTDKSALTDIEENYAEMDIKIDGKIEKASFAKANIKGNPKIPIILVCSEHFAQKKAVYTYTEEDEKECPEHKKGTGHTDARLLDTLLCKAAAHIIALLAEERANKEGSIVLCEDAACALACVYLKEYCTKGNIRSIVTIHNALSSYHHEFYSLDEAIRYTSLPREVLCGAFNGHKVEPYLLAAGCAALTTVSSQYADELTGCDEDDVTDGLSAAFRTRSIKIKGILNGIDYYRYDPAKDTSLLPYKFDAASGDFGGKVQCKEYVLKKYFAIASDVKMAIFCYHGRMVHQKGIAILCQAIRSMFEKGKEFLFIAMGQGESSLESMASLLAEDYKDKAVYIKGYDKALSRLVIAASDFIVLPSISEPCGQEDYIAQIYGTIPIAHATGGLKKIEDGKNGFLYCPNNAQTLFGVLENMINMKQDNKAGLEKMAIYAAQNVRDNHSWQTAAREYLRIGSRE